MTLIEMAVNARYRYMKHIHRYPTIRLLAAVLITVAVIVLSSLATHAPAQNQSWLTLKNIRTDNATSFYADNRADRAWFVEMVLPTGDSNVMTENLKSVAATL